jgi:putative effector of murein hydrolase
MFEHRMQPLLSRKAFAQRMILSVFAALGLVALALLIGMFGYRYAAGLPWIDALLNAAMILTGMGPVDPMHDTSAKLFASAYAIFSGVTFPTVIAILLAPVVHRFLHRLHLETEHKSGR